MAALKVGLFDNGAAADWLAALERQGATLLTTALSAVADAHEEAHLDVVEAIEAMAAAETVAASSSRTHRLPIGLSAWRVHHDAGLAAMAVRAVKRILASSELADRWAESEGGAAWRNDAQNLIALLRRAPHPR